MLVIGGCAPESANGPSLSRLDLKSLTAELESLQATAPAGLFDGSLGRQGLAPEKSRVKLGFIKLTDCAPLVLAKELGYFRAEGLEVDVEAQPNW
ncbi:MAG: ABC transporter substrate-binding protein, partial [Pirellulaceae bacterium]